MPVSLPNRLDLSPIARRLQDHYSAFGHIPNLTLAEAGRFLTDCMALMFPHFADHKHQSGPELEARLMTLAGRLRFILCEVRPENCPRTDQIVSDFIEALPDIAEEIRLDAQAILDNDPAAASINEVILAYPGLRAVAAYRVAHRLVRHGVGEFPRLVAEFAHKETGVDINPTAEIGRSLFLDHGTGIVIGGTAVIGDNVKIYQGVTLGALRVRRSECAKKRHPTIEDNVTIYANATILGGETVVGRNSVIGGNVWLTKSLPADSVLMYKSGLQGFAEPDAESADHYSI
ncbi:serine O-acetyltransferase [Rhodothalassium salexigens DSM 2132]|uniref:Serine acetyltransferase n=1 Tax=Rhodothalassium salexigens DSM 2132 TaxID=1188247 RepID=A0A4R2PQD2_RHOSA|nr:serine O-acetyltransferase EpsC [Rhodothalassium salexigens]MBB4210921.1 serine O-acetyltransferase [Rhodothalassium salexigens DSM 2132]MBK1639474.1 hypothetical protein [Rhodothalassium salexigens DSM 2132]TCP36421.1 serine O-acetyltransferase [Rhodothalassium salexigens DSM 2132]